MALQDKIVTIEDVPRIAYRVLVRRGITHHRAEDVAHDVTVALLTASPAYLTAKYIAITAIHLLVPRPRVEDGACPFDPEALLCRLPRDVDEPDDDTPMVDPDDTIAASLAVLTPLARDVAEAILGGQTVLGLTHSLVPDKSGPSFRASPRRSAMYRTVRSATARLRRYNTVRAESTRPFTSRP